MLSILFLILCSVYGISLIRMLVPDIRRLIVAIAPSKNVAEFIPDCMFTIPAGTVIGMMTAAAFSYYLTSLEARFISSELMVKKTSAAITIAFFVVLTAVNFSVYFKNKKKRVSYAALPEYRNTSVNILFYGLSIVFFTCISSYLFFSTYRIYGSTLSAGLSVFSDLAPHTAMVSSFSAGFNFPTQYMHFAGDGIQYHFFFYYLCGLLCSLGLPIDFAINLPSIITMVCAFVLMGFLATILFKRRLAFLATAIFVLLRSSLNFIYQISETMQDGNSFSGALKLIFSNTAWYGKTPYDTWGIWAINVYSNQRHLMLGVSCILIMVILLLPFIRRMCISIIKSESLTSSLKCFFIDRNAWIWRSNDPLNPLGIMILVMILVTVMPFFHGSALIAGLLIAALMAVFSESRVIYMCMAACAVISAFIQTRLFAGNVSNVFSPHYQFGFVCENKTIVGALQYLVIVTGATFTLALIYVFILSIRDAKHDTPAYRPLLFLCSLVPLIYAFNWQTSLEMLANHKFIQISIIFADIFVAGFISELFHLPFAKNEKKEYVCPKGKRIALRAVAATTGVILLVPLLTTGVFEWATYVNLNKGTLDAKTNSPLVEWIEENTDTSDVFLTPYWSYNRFILTGRAMYYGWPYFAWSAGHDTDTRLVVYSWLLSGCGGDVETFRNYCRSRGIQYVVDDPEFNTVELAPGYSYNHEFFAENLTQVAYFPEDNGTIIYKIYD